MCTPRKSNPRELKVDNIMSLEVGRCTSRSRALRIIRRMSEALSFLFASFLYSIHSPLKEVKSKKKKKKKKKLIWDPYFHNSYYAIQTRKSINWVANLTTLEIE
jgi:hypothetical protein